MQTHFSRARGPELRCVVAERGPGKELVVSRRADDVNVSQSCLWHGGASYSPSS